MDLKSLKLTVRVFYDVQDIRKKAGNRLFGIQRDVGISEDEANWLTEKVYDRIFLTEKAIHKDIRSLVHDMPIWNAWLQYVWGIGETLAGALIADIGDISCFDNPSKIWAYSGMGVIEIVKENGATKRWFPTHEAALDWVTHATDLEVKMVELWNERQPKGTPKRPYDRESKISSYLSHCCWGAKYEYETIANRRIVGLPDNTNQALKVTAWKVGQQFLKGKPKKSKYRAYFDECKEYYVKRDGDRLTKGHVNNRALRKTTKLFLSHLWHQMRKLQGLPTTTPYCLEHLGHQDFIPPFYDKEPCDP